MKKMGLTKQYLKYVPGGNLNIIADSKCNAIFVTLEGQEGRFVAVGACEHVYIWDLRLGEKVQVLSGEKAVVTCLVNSPNKRQIAAGYSDGSVKIFDLRTAENIHEFIGHNSEITCLAYDQLGHRLASGSKDTNITLWDVVAGNGICKLIGHKNVITQVAFMQEHNILISSSKDTLIKFWDIDTQHNFRTLLSHRSEVWGFALVKNDKYLISACNNPELQIWKIYFVGSAESENEICELSLEDNEDDDSQLKYPLRCGKMGTMKRYGKGRADFLTVDYTGQVVGCHGNDNIIESFYFLSEEEIKLKQKKRLEKEKKKKDRVKDVILKDRVNRLSIINLASGVKSLDLIMGRGNELRVCSVLSNNSIELHSLSVTDKDTEPQALRSITSHGHRTDVRAICFSSDNLAFASVSGDSVKLWNRPTLTCLRTVECGYALCATFVPGDRHLIVGLKSGKMLIIDIAAGDILEEIPAHENEIWSVTLLPSLKGVVSGGSDKTVKFWQFELIEDPDSERKAKVLSLIHYHTLNVNDSVLSVRICPNNRFIAIALLDSTVTIFFLDTFKHFVTLYGHKLPVLCMDISYDSTLIATGSADRNIKIWGLDFGDCHKSMFAHDDSVTGISFIPKTHYLFTCGKDGRIKQWDADLFQKITTLQGHSGQAHNCAVSPNGVFLATCGADKVIRMYEKSSEILVLEDEAEEDREKQEQELATGETTQVPGLSNLVLPTRKTANSERAADLILECLEICRNYKQECSSVAPPNPMPPVPLLMKSYKCNTVEDFLLETFMRVKTSDLEEALLLLPFSSACEILEMLPKLLENQYQAELKATLALKLIQVHHSPIVASQELLPQIEKIQQLAMKQILSLRDMVGFNLYGMLSLQRDIEEKEGIDLFRDASKAHKKQTSKKKNKQRAVKRAVMAL